jgi:hypothetical protein
MWVSDTLKGLSLQQIRLMRGRMWGWESRCKLSLRRLVQQSRYQRVTRKCTGQSLWARRLSNLPPMMARRQKTVEEQLRRKSRILLPQAMMWECSCVHSCLGICVLNDVSIRSKMACRESMACCRPPARICFGLDTQGSRTRGLEHAQPVEIWHLSQKAGPVETLQLRITYLLPGPLERT